MNSFLAGSVFIGRYFGINVRVHITFLIFAGFRLLDSMNSGLGFTATWMALLFLLILTHEFGHCLAARMVDGDAQEILMWPLGGLAFAHAPMTPWAQFVTVAGGPLVNVIWCVICGAAVSWELGTWRWIDWSPFSSRGLPWRPDDWITYAIMMFQISYYLLLFNLLPVYPMDGGQLFWTMIWPALGLQRATEIAAQVGVGGAIVLGGLGFANGNWTLVMVAGFGAFTCYQRLQALKYGQVFDERVATYDATGRSRRKRTGFWSRLFGTRTRPAAPGDVPPRQQASVNPNPGGWEAKINEDERLESDVDRILKKVHEQGIGSLTYVEKQTLERARRMRIDQEREYQGGGTA